MYTICIAKGFPEAENVNRLMKKTDPAGRHEVRENAEDALDLMDVKTPDVIWLAAEEDNFALAADSHSKGMVINFIYVANDASGAAEAFKVRASGYVTEPVTGEDVKDELDNLRFPVDEEERRLRIQCFGNFEVFSNGRITRFSRSLSKEALAYMVDRRGAGCTVGEICSVLWENRPIDTNLKSQCRVILASLKKDLEAVGAGAVLVKGWNTWGIDTDRIECDYYDFLRSKGRAEESYRGEYMAQYSWAEMTSGTLYQMASE